MSVKTRLGYKYVMLRKASQNNFEIKLNCPYCKKSFKTIQAIAIHFSKIHKIVEDKDEVKSNKKIDDKELTPKQFLRMLNGLSALVDLEVILQ